MRRAVELALEAVREGLGGPFGAVIVRNGKILAEGRNRVLESSDPTAHAEVCAIRSACAALGSFSLEGCELYASCEPCPMCYTAAAWARLECIWYSGTSSEAASAGFDDTHLHSQLAMCPERRTLPLRACMPEAAGEAFEAWRAKTDRIAY